MQVNTIVSLIDHLRANSLSFRESFSYSFQLFLVILIRKRLVSPFPVFLGGNCARLCFFSSPKLKSQVHFSDHIFVCRSSVRLSVNFSHIQNLFKNNWTNFNQFETKHPRAKGIQSCDNKGPHLFLKEDF